MLFFKKIKPELIFISSVALFFILMIGIDKSFKFYLKKNFKKNLSSISYNISYNQNKSSEKITIDADKFISHNSILFKLKKTVSIDISNNVANITLRNLLAEEKS